MGDFRYVDIRVIGMHVRRFLSAFLVIVFISTSISSLASTGQMQISTGYVVRTRRMHLPVDTTAEASSTYWDSDGNGITDILEKRLDLGGSENAILEFSRTLTDDDREKFISMGFGISSFLSGFDMIEVNGVRKGNVDTLTSHPGVDMVWHTGALEWFGDVQTRNIKARESEEYSPNTAWELGYDGSGVSIAVMDTGVDNAHPSLRGKWLGGADISKPETFLTPRDGSFDADDPQGHGTTCSGIAMGTGAREGTYMGSAPGARLVDLRIGTVVGYAPGEVYQDIYDASLQGAQWALDHRDDAWSGGGADYQGIDVLSLSWGVDVGSPSPGDDPYSVSLNRLVEAGVHVVAAAGNEGPGNNGFHGMGAADLIITVGATDDDDTVNRTDDFIASYSSRGPRTDDGDDYTADELKPDISASGTHIIQCQYSSNPLDDASGNSYGNRGSGTSYATPSVVGVVALMLEANPELTPAVTKEILRATAERRGEASLPEVDPFWNRDFGWGIVDGHRAVEMAEGLGDVSSVDVELQCFIANFTTEGSVNVIEGVAWSRTGDRIDRVEVSVDGAIHSVEMTDESGNNFVNWTVRVRTDAGGPANVSAVAIGGGKQSLRSVLSVELVATGAQGGGLGTAGTFLLVAVIAVLVVAGGGAYAVHRRKKRKGPGE